LRHGREMQHPHSTRKTRFLQGTLYRHPVDCKV